ncbi:MAG: SEL1-like repeat protein [Pseudomonadota bacterium]
MKNLTLLATLLSVILIVLPLPALAQLWQLRLPEDGKVETADASAFVEGTDGAFGVTLNSGTGNWQAFFFVRPLSDSDVVSFTIKQLDDSQTERHVLPADYVVDDRYGDDIRAVRFDLTEGELAAMASGYQLFVSAGSQKFVFSLDGSAVISTLVEELAEYRDAILEDLEHGTEHAKSDCMQAALRGEGMVIDCLDDNIEIARVDLNRFAEFVEVMHRNNCRISAKASDAYFRGAGFEDTAEIRAIMARLFYFGMARIVPSSNGLDIEVYGDPCPAPEDAPSSRELFIEALAQNECSLHSSEANDTLERIGVHRQEIKLMLPYLQKDGTLVVWDNDEMITLTEDVCYERPMSSEPAEEIIQSEDQSEAIPVQRAMLIAYLEANGCQITHDEAKIKLPQAGFDFEALDRQVQDFRDEGIVDFGPDETLILTTGTCAQSVTGTATVANVATDAVCAIQTPPQDRLAACTRDIEAAESRIARLPALINRAAAHAELENYHSALADLDQAIENGALQSSGVVEFLMARAQAQEALNMRAWAIETYSSILEMHDFPAARLARGKLVGRSDIFRAMEDYRAVVFSEWSNEEEQRQAQSRINQSGLQSIPLRLPDELTRDIIARVGYGTFESTNPYLSDRLIGLFVDAHIDGDTPFDFSVPLGTLDQPFEDLRLSTTIRTIDGRLAAFTQAKFTRDGEEKQLTGFFSEDNNLWKMVALTAGDTWDLAEALQSAIARKELAAEVDRIVHECDRLAAHPRDSQRVTDGMSFDRIDSSRAVAECTAALRDYPGTPRFLFQLGRAHDRAERYGEARDAYNQAAESDYAIAMNSLAYLYAHGEGVAKDKATAAYWYERAAQNEHVPAMMNIAQALADGDGVDQNHERALYWFTYAANFGNAAAMNRVGHYHWNGYGTPRDMQEARVWLERAASRGHATASFNLAVFYDEDAHSGRRDPERSAQYLLQAVSGGSKAALRALTEQSQSWGQDTMKAVQAELKRLGHYSGGVDGKIGPQTLRAIQQLQ